MKAKTLRHLIIGLLTLTGVFHLLVALLGGAPGLALPVAGFGLVFVVIGFLARSDTKDGSKSHSRNALIAAIAACTAGLGLGGNAYLQSGEPASFPIMAIIDIAIIAASVMWFAKRQAKKRL